MKSKRQIIILLIVITLAQIITRIYLGDKKQYFHMDEAYSYGLMNYNKLNITDNEDFINTWHDKYYYKDYLEVNSDEISNIKPVYENQKNDVHPPFYYLLLRIISTCSINNFTKWTGIILNIIIFAISNIFIYLICKKLFKNQIFALIVCFINGFSLIALDSCLYIRMYELCNLNILIATYLHLKMYHQKDIKNFDIIFLMINLLIGGLTHYYYFVYVLVLYVISTISYIRKKEKQKLIRYQISIFISAIIYLCIFPYSISHILFGNRGITSGSSINIIIKFVGYMKIINDRFFNKLFLLLLVAIIILCWKKVKEKKLIDKQILLIVLPCIIYTATIIITSPYIETRYIIPIYSSIIISTVYLIKIYLNKFWDNKSTLFLIALLFLIILYSPKMTNTKLEFTYEQYNNIAKYIKEKQLPIIYIWNTENNRFLDDIYLFTLVDKSIILDYNQPAENIKQIIQENNTNFILICNEGIEETKLKQCISGNMQYKQRMNACDIYEVDI